MKVTDLIKIVNRETQTRTTALKNEHGSLVSVSERFAFSQGGCDVRKEIS